MCFLQTYLMVILYIYMYIYVYMYIYIYMHNYSCIINHNYASVCIYIHIHIFPVRMAGAPRTSNFYSPEPSVRSSEFGSLYDSSVRSWESTSVEVQLRWKNGDNHGNTMVICLDLYWYVYIYTHIHTHNGNYPVKLGCVGILYKYGYILNHRLELHPRSCRQ